MLPAAAIPIAGGWNPEDAFKKAGGAPKYTEYEGVGHDSWTKTYESPEVWKWLFTQRRKY